MPSDARVAYVTQTTLSVDDTRDLIAALTRRYPYLVGPEVDDICYATQNRQQAVKLLADDADVVLVVGATNSSNSQRLREVVAQRGKPAYLISDVRDLDPAWLTGARRVGITAGASAPEYLVEEVRRELFALGATSERELGTISENVTFRLPSSVLRRRPTRTPDAVQPAFAASLSG
jgi:4-hydroxy-3-methylbut-2-enyl diphosphate reductase